MFNKPMFYALLLGVLAVQPGHAMAATNVTARALAQSKDCLACHAIGEKIVGPAYQDIAARYAGQKDVEDGLIQKVLRGTRGNWGQARMPANPQVSEEEARILIKWVLSLGK